MGSYKKLIFQPTNFTHCYFWQIFWHLEPLNKAVRQEIQDLEDLLEKSKQSKSEKDHQIRTMQDEMDNQESLISRLSKEKKQLQDSNQKTAEDLQVVKEFE